VGRPSDNPSTASPDLCTLDGLLNRALSELDGALAKVGSKLSSSTADPADSGGQSGLSRALQKIVAEVQSARAVPTGGTLPRRSGLETLLLRAEEALSRFEGCAKEECRRASHAGANAAEWERNAALAVRAKDDDLARAALANRTEALQLQSSFTHHADLLDREVVELRQLIETIRRSASA
jgi:hypothetical protein